MKSQPKSHGQKNYFCTFAQLFKLSHGRNGGIKSLTMKRLFTVFLLFGLTTVAVMAAKSLYIPNEWRQSGSSIYKETDRNNQYTWSKSRSKQSDNFIVYWDKDWGNTAPNALSSSSEYYVDIDDLLEKAEQFYQVECNTLGFVDPTTSNVGKYKIMILLNHTTDWVCYGGGYDFQVPALWLSPNTCKPVGSAVAHEVGHSFHYMCYAEDSNYGANSNIQTGFHGAVGQGATIWETTANWQALQSYPNEIFTESGTADIFAKSHNYAFTHEWHRYQSYMFLFYLCQYYGDVKTVANVWNQRETSVKDFNQVLMDNKGLTVTDLYRLHFNFAMHAVTYDLDACADYLQDSYIGKFEYFCTKTDDGAYQVAYASCPQGTGFNVIPLNVPAAGATVTTQLTALTPGCALTDSDPGTYLNGESTWATSGVSNYNSVSNASSRGFRAGYVALLSNGTRQYFDDNTVHCTGTGEVTENISMTVPENVSKLWLVVAPAPSVYQQHLWDENFQNDDQWPYRVKFIGTNLGSNATVVSSPVIDGRAISDVTLTYDVRLKPASDYSNATVKVSGEALSQVGTALQLTAAQIAEKMVAYSSSGPSNGQVMFYAAKSNGTLQQSGSTANGYGHWFNTAGNVVSYGSNSYVYSEFYPSAMEFTVGQFPDLNASGDQRTIAQALKYKDNNGNTATAYFIFNITFDSNAGNSGTIAGGGAAGGVFWYLGDINMDGTVSLADLTEMVNILLGKNTSYKKLLADMSEDGTISMDDLTALVNTILGKAPLRTVLLTE